MADPFTVGAQIVNFLILIWILRRILYGPITRAMDARETRIRGELDNARRLQSEAAAEGERSRQLIADFEASRAERASEARAELEVWRREHTMTVRQDVEAMRQRWQQALDQEKDAFLAELRRRAGREVLEVTRRVLQELADSDLDARVTSRFLIELRQLSPESRTRLEAAAREDGGQVHVRTAYPLAEREQEHLRAGIAEALGAGLTPDFATETELVSGVELRAGGLKVAWALGDYLESLEEALGETLAIQGELASDGR